MDSGFLGKADLAASTDTDIGPPIAAGFLFTASVSFANRTAADINVRLAIRNGAITDADYVEYDAVLPSNGALERTGIVIGPGEQITVRASAVGVSVRAAGFAEVV